MSWIQKFINMAAVPISMTVLVMSSLPRMAIAESPVALKFQKFQNWQISQKFIPPNRNAPQTTSGGATRRGSRYLESKETLTALMPLNKIGLTLAERPTFYWFIPQIPVETARFSLLDGEDIVYETTFKLPRQLGIIGFTLPTKAPSLKVGTKYHWYMSIADGSEEVGEGITVDGWVERIQPTNDLSKQLATTNLKQLSQVYAASGIWYEVLHTLVQQRLSDPSDRTVMANWQALLESVELKNLVSKPLSRYLECQD